MLRNWLVDRIETMPHLFNPRNSALRLNTHLPAITDLLREDTVLISQPVSVTGDAKRCHAVQEACGQTTQTPVAQAGILLDLLQFLDV